MYQFGCADNNCINGPKTTVFFAIECAGKELLQ